MQLARSASCMAESSAALVPSRDLPFRRPAWRTLIVFFQLRVSSGDLRQSGESARQRESESHRPLPLQCLPTTCTGLHALRCHALGLCWIGGMAHALVGDVVAETEDAIRLSRLGRCWGGDSGSRRRSAHTQPGLACGTSESLACACVSVREQWEGSSSCIKGAGSPACVRCDERIRHRCIRPACAQGQCHPWQKGIRLHKRAFASCTARAPGSLQAAYAPLSLLWRAMVEGGGAAEGKSEVHGMSGHSRRLDL